MSDYETAQRRRNLTVGIFVVMGFCSFAWLIFKFGDLPTAFSKVGSYHIFVQFPTAPGVQRDTPVRFCGYQIGRVTRVMPPKVRRDLVTGQEYHQTVAVVNIDNKYSDIPSNVEVKLMTRGLGSSYIELKVDPAKLPALPYDPNRPETTHLVDELWLQGSTGITSEFFPEESQKKLDALLQDVRGFVNNANEIIGDQGNQKNIKNMLANLTEASGHVSKAMEKASEMIEEAERTLVEFKTLASTGTSTLKKADELVAAIVGASDELGKAASRLRLVLDKINSGEGTAGKLVNDARLYESLLEGTVQLQLMMGKLKTLLQKVDDEGLRSIY